MFRKATNLLEELFIIQGYLVPVLSFAFSTYFFGDAPDVTARVEGEGLARADEEERAGKFEVDPDREVVRIRAVISILFDVTDTNLLQGKAAGKGCVEGVVDG